jgi:hypothetical protein
MQYKTKQTIIQSQRINALGNKKFFLPDDINKNYRDLEHPDIKKSPFYQLAGLFKLKNLSPEHMSNLNNNEFFKSYELNKDKLEEIKKELQKNPEKFLNLWGSALDKEFEKYYEDIENKELLEYEKNYRLKNEGKSMTDFLPMKAEWEKFKKNWAEYKARTMDLLRTITIEMLYDIIKKEESVVKMDDYQNLYNLLKEDDVETDFAFDKLQVLRDNVRNVIIDDELFKSLESDNKHAVKLREKMIELTQKMIVQELGGSDVDGLEKGISDLFKGTTESSNVLEAIYVKYATKGLFKRVLKKSKASVIQAVRSNIYNELQSNKAELMSKLKSAEPLNIIYENEKHVLEKLLKNFYELKLNLILMELNQARGADTKLHSIDEFIQHMKDITFSQIILNDEKIPDTLNLIVGNNTDYSKERQFVELYVYLKENSKNDVFKILNSVLANTAWMEDVKKYAANGKVNIKFDDFVDKNNKRKLDENIENFMKNRFNEIIYSEEPQEYEVNKMLLDDLVNNKTFVENIQKLIRDYRTEEVILNENIHGVEDFNKQKKIQAYELKIRLMERIKNFENDYNVENLKVKYTDYITNKDYYIHKILTNGKNDLFKSDVKEIAEYGKFLLSVEKIVENAWVEINKEITNYNFNDFEYFEKVKQAVREQSTYLAKLESLNNFLHNNKKYKDLILNNFYNLFDYSNRYDIIVLTNNPRCDVEKLYGFVSSELNRGAKRLSIVYSDYIVSEDFTGLLDNYTDLSQLEMNLLMTRDDNAIAKEGVRKLVSFEVSRINRDITAKDAALEDTVQLVLDKERNIYDELVAIGKIKEGDRYGFGSDSQDVLPEKVLASLNSFKQLNTKVVDPSNVGKNDVQSLKDYIAKNVNPGLKFSKIIDLMYGKSKSLRTFIIDEDDKLPTDYLKPNEIDQIFKNKLPLDLIKTALDVYDARLIKALKLKLAKMKISDKSNTKLLNDKSFKLPYSPNEIYHLSHDLEIDYQESLKKLTPESSASEIKRVKETIDDIEGFHNTIKDEISLEEGKKIIFNKGSIFETVIKFNKMDADEKDKAMQDLLNFTKTNVNKPDFSDKYSVLKYVYDYYMGTLNVFYDNHIEDAHVRINNYNNILFYERLEKYYYSADNDGLKKGLGAFLNTNAWERSVKNINFEKVYNKPEEVDLPKRFKNMKNFVKNLPIKSYLENIQWVENPNEELSKFAANELKKNINIYYYQNLKDEGILDDTMRQRAAEGMYLTEDFRNKVDFVEKENKNLEELANNLNSETDSTPVYSKLINESKPYSHVFEEMFASYFKNRKERLQYTKEKLAEIKPYANSDNLNKKYYEKLHKEGTVELDIDTFVKTNAMYKEYPKFSHSDVTDIVELDNASSYAQYGKLANLPNWLLIDEDVELVDTKINANTWFEKQVDEIIDQFFERRGKVERYISRDELKALDADFSQYLNSENVLKQVRQKLIDEEKVMNMLADALESVANFKGDQITQSTKMKADQYDFNKNMKNENAAYKSLAYSIRKKVEFQQELQEYLSKQKTKSKRHLRRFLRESEENFDIYNFSNYYHNNLDKSVFRKEENGTSHRGLSHYTSEVYSTEADKIAHADKILEYSNVTTNKSKNVLN